jgi:hypothetical protein
MGAPTFGGWPEKSPAEYEAERKVIEAAEAAKDDIRYFIAEDGDSGPGVMRCIAFLDALDLLQAAKEKP